MSKINELEELLAPPIEQAGYECVEIAFEKKGKDWVLTAYIDKDGGVSLDDCEKVSEILSPILDEEDPIEPSYFLEVSSPGIDRPLKKERDFEKALDSLIEVNLYQKLNGSKKFEGLLKDYSEDEIILEIDGDNLSIPRDKIAKAVPVVEI